MHWNFKSDKPKGRGYGTFADAVLFFMAVVLVIAVAVLPVSHFTSGALPGQHVFRHSLLFTGPIGFVMLAFYWRWLRKAKRQCYLSVQPEELTVTYRLVNGLLVLFIGGWGMFGVLNARLDRGDAYVYYSQILDKTIDTEGRFENYKLLLAHWQAENDPIEMAVDSKLYSAVSGKSECLRFEVKPGAFGSEWMVSHQHFALETVAYDFEDKSQTICEAAWAQKIAQQGHSKVAQSDIELGKIRPGEMAVNDTGFAPASEQAPYR